MSTVDEPASTKLRVAEPDLRVVLQYTPEECEDVMSNEHDGENTGTANKQVEKEYLLYQVVLAKHSKFVDTTLSVDMKEKQTKTIVFKDVTPEVFEKALEYLESPTAAREATPLDILQVVQFYHMYEFPEGLEFSEHVLKDYFDQETQSMLAPKHLQFLVDAVSLSDHLKLEKALKAGCSCINSITDPVGGQHVDAFIFSEDMIRTLQPLIVEKKIVLPFALRCEQLSNEELSSPLFPKYFVKHTTEQVYPYPSGFHLQLDNCGFNQKFAFYGCGAIGPLWQSADKEMAFAELEDSSKVEVYVHRVRSITYPHHEFFADEQKQGDWAIIIYPPPSNSFEDNFFLPIPIFWAPYSAHLPVPPSTNWQSTRAAESKLLGNPTLSYE